MTPHSVLLLHKQEGQPGLTPPQATLLLALAMLTLLPLSLPQRLPRMPSRLTTQIQEGQPGLTPPQATLLKALSAKMTL